MTQFIENIDRQFDSLYDSLEDSGFNVTFKKGYARVILVKKQAGNTDLIATLKEENPNLSVKKQGADIIIEEK